MKKLGMRRLAPLAVALAGCLALVITQPAAASGPDWASSFEQAVQIAKKEQRPIFVDFSTSWCGICKLMDRTVMNDPAIIARLDNFVKVKVDGDVRPDLCSAYGVMAYPTFIHLDANGRVISKREGQMRLQEMADALDRTWQSAGRSTAIAQANQQRQIPTVSNGNRTNLVASAGLTIAPKSEDKEQPAATHQSDRAEDSRVAKGGGYDPRDPQLQNSVYAMEPATASRRSRFGGSDSNDLRQLAEATARPAEGENTKELTVAKADDEKAETDAKPLELVKADANKKTTNSDAKDEKVSDKVEAKEVAKTEAKADAELTLKAPAQMAKGDTAPVVASRLEGISDAELPKPLLSRGTAASQPMSAPSIVAVSNPTSSLKSLAAAAADKEQLSKPRVETVASARDGSQSEKLSGSAVVSSAKQKEEDEAKPASKKDDEKPKESAKSEEDPRAKTKTSKGATLADVDRWMSDAESKLVAARKKEARAMYTKVVENDPENKSGKSDIAYVKMVSLIVDKDSDLQRREAYSKIKEFEARYRNSDHKDYYTLIRAILAADLGETNEAHRLLGTYTERFPESKYCSLAHKTWKELPPVKKESDKKKASADSSRSSKSSKSKDS